MELALSIRDIESEVVKIQSDEVLNEITHQLEEAKRVGLKGQITKLKRQAMARVLELHDMCLIGAFTFHHEWDLKQWYSNGDIKRVGKMPPYSFRRTKLSKYKGNIPQEIISKLPNNSAKKAWIFYESLDPIIAVKLKWGWYAGIFKWE